MGWFSSSTEHVYNVSGTELYEDMPPLIQTTIRGTVTANRNIAKDLTANLVNGVLWNVRALHNWASKPGNYPYGLPNGTMANVVVPKSSVIQSTVSADLGFTVHIGFVRVEPEHGTYVYYVEYWPMTDTGEIIGEPDLWIYDTADNTYPVLNIDKSVESTTPYTPIMPICVNNSFIDQGDEEVARKVRRALNYIDLDLEELCDGMRESRDENPDSSMPDDAYVVLGVSAARNTERTNEYLYRFFKRMYGESEISYSENEYWAANKVPTETTVQNGWYTSVKEVPHTSLPPTNELHIKDSQYDQRLSWDYITHRIYNGSLGKPQTHHVSFKYVLDYTYTTTTGSFYEAGSDRQEHTQTHYVYKSELICRKQLNATQVEEYLASGLVTDFNVVNRERVGISLQEAFEDPEELDSPFIIPLRTDILRDMGNIRSHDLIYESVWLMGMHHDTYKVKWYEKGFFKIFTMAVVIVVTAVFAPEALPSVVQGMIVSMVITTAFTPLLEDIFGQEMAMVISVIATALALGFDPSQLATQSPTMAATTVAETTSVITTAVSVQSIAMASMQLYAGLKTIDLQDQMEDLSKAIDDLTTEMDEYHEANKIDVYNKGITMANVTSDPWNIMDPSQYVTNTLDEPNKPLKGPMYTQHYVDASLHLDMPKTVINVGNS